MAFSCLTLRQTVDAPLLNHLCSKAEEAQPSVVYLREVFLYVPDFWV